MHDKTVTMQFIASAQAPQEFEDLVFPALKARLGLRRIGAFEMVNGHTFTIQTNLSTNELLARFQSSVNDRATVRFANAHDPQVDLEILNRSREIGQPPLKSPRQVNPEAVCFVFEPKT